MRKRINVKLTSSEVILSKHAAKVKYISSKMFNENYFAINRIKEQLVLNTPIYVGMTVLELSKPLMHNFYYNYILNKYDKNIKLVFTDTDILLYEIKKMTMFIRIYMKTKMIKKNLILVIMQKIMNIFLKIIKR